MTLNDEKAAELLWAEWQYRHDVYWRSLYRWGGAAVSVSVLPYLRPEVLALLGYAVLAFPLIALALAVTGGWHLSAEYARLKAVGEQYDKLRDGYVPDRLPEGKASSWSIGKTVSGIFYCGLSLLSIANGVILLLLVHGGATSGA